MRRPSSSRSWRAPCWPGSRRATSIAESFARRHLLGRSLVPAEGAEPLADADALERHAGVTDAVRRPGVLGDPVEPFALMRLGVAERARPGADLEEERHAPGAMMHRVHQLEIRRPDVDAEFFPGLSRRPCRDRLVRF